LALDHSILPLIFLKSSDVMHNSGCSDRRVGIAGEGWLHEARLGACFRLLANVVVPAGGFVR
jgi:hypothetical protein